MGAYNPVQEAKSLMCHTQIALRMIVFCGKRVTYKAVDNSWVVQAAL